MFWVVSASCQKTEFEIYPNGLIYSEQTMNKLRHVADSLNLNLNLVVLIKSSIPLGNA